MSGQRRRHVRRAERAIAVASILSALGAVGFAVVYALGGQTQLEGAALGLAFAGLASGLGIWATRLLPQGGHVEEHGGFASPELASEALADRLTELDHPWRRAVLVRLLGLAAGSIGLALVFPLRSLLAPGLPGPTHTLRHTPWRSGGLRLVDATGRPVRADQVTPETVLTVYPDGHVGAGDAPAFVVRLDPSRFTTRPPASGVAGIVAYSLLCTHAGCPVGLYEQGAARMLCACHQSVFDLLAGGKPIAGPAGRALPGLPITVDSEGYLRATGDFSSPPGAGFWSRR
jgi:ubiquinol-cytochrome c reductase iron-sulfur subunit